MRGDPFPSARFVADQVAAYLAYFVKARDFKVLIWAALFLAVAILPALLIDIARMPSALYEAMSRPPAKRTASGSP